MTMDIATCSMFFDSSLSANDDSRMEEQCRGFTFISFETQGLLGMNEGCLYEVKRRLPC